MSAMAGEEVRPGDWMPATLIKPFVGVVPTTKSSVLETARRPVKERMNFDGSMTVVVFRPSL